MNNVDLKTENVVGEINLLLLNIPQNLTLLEKIRWLYIKIGKLFSYDYRISDDFNVAYKEIDFENNYVGRYQTCIQITRLFDILLKYIDQNLETNIIERKLNIRGLDKQHNLEHKANEIILPTGEKYILDLTLDLYLIQSGCLTKHFCFESDEFANYDTLSPREIKLMDEKLNLIDDHVYTDVKIDSVKKELEDYDYNGMNQGEIIDFKIKKINTLLKNFNGYHEGKQYVNKLFLELLNISYKEFNLTYKNNDMLELVTCFVLDDNKWIIYNNKLGLVSTSKENIIKMLNQGWHTKSNTLENIRRGVK